MAKTNRELCLLAIPYVPGKYRVAGMMLSRKLDGMRCLWLKATKGMAVKDIPFANRDKDSRDHIATGLWSRYGKIIHCPPDFTAGWPDYPLDGELYIGRQTFQQLMSTVKDLVPDRIKWAPVKYMVFDSPTYEQVFATGRINNPQYTKRMVLEDNMLATGAVFGRPIYRFEQTYSLLKRDLVETDTLKLLEQILTPFNTEKAAELIEATLNQETSAGGEGLMLRLPTSFWVPERTWELLKIKKLQDAECTVEGFYAGEIGKDGKLRGMLGSLLVRWQGITFKLSGYTDEERGLTPAASTWAWDHPGELFPGDISNPSIRFTVGETITFRYTELTEGNIPKCARYFRKAT